MPREVQFTFKMLHKVRPQRDDNQDAYICVAQRGYFDPHGGKKNRPTSYSVKWLKKAASKADSTKTAPATKEYKNRTGPSTQTAPANEYKNRTQRKTEQKEKQQQRGVGDLLPAAELAKVIELLRREGFDKTSLQLNPADNTLN